MSASRQFCLFWLCLLIPCILNGQGAMEEAQAFYEKGDYARALPGLIEAEKTFVADPDLTVRIASCYYQLRQPQEAIRYYQKIGIYLNRFPQEMADYADALFMNGNYTEALDVYKQLQVDLPELAAKKTRCLQNALKERTERSQYVVKPIEGNSRYAESTITFYNKQVLIGAQVHPRVEGQLSLFSNQIFGGELDAEGNVPVLRHAGLVLDTSAAFVHVNSMPGRNSLVLTVPEDSFYGPAFRPGAVRTGLYFQDFNTLGEPYSLRPFPYNDASYSNGYAALSPDGNTLYFASDRPDGFGGFDLYFCTRKGNSWSEPINLGPGINTSGNEFAPYLFDNIFYFASDGWCGFGGYDLFSAPIENKTMQAPVNMGWGVNSTRDDFGMIYDGTRNAGFFISNRPESNGSDDIFSLHFRAKILTIQVLDATDNAYLAGTIIDFSRCDDPYRSCDAEGKCVYYVYEGMNCFVTISKIGYTESAFHINYDSIPGATKSLRIFLVKTGRFAVGQLLDTEKNPMLHVRIQAINQLDGEIQETYSNHEGRFAVSLRSGVNYILRFSKEGYEMLSRRIDGSEIGDSTDLGQSIMRAKANRPEVVITSMPPQSIVVPYEAYKEEQIAETGPDSVVIPSSAVIYGYVIQLAAANLPFTSLKYFEQKLNGLGQVYVKHMEGYYKVKLGYYRTEKEALAVLENVRRNGFVDAFITRDAFAEAYLKLKEQVQEGIQMLQDTTVNYKVKLVSVMNEDLPDLSLIRHLGQIEILTVAEWKTVLLGDYHSISAAQEAMDSAVKAGFEEAHIVILKDGLLVRVDLGY